MKSSRLWDALIGWSRHPFFVGHPPSIGEKKGVLQVISEKEKW
jgi:hypothetical protein